MVNDKNAVKVLEDRYADGPPQNHGDLSKTTAAKAEEKINEPLFDISRLNLSDAERLVYQNLNTEPAHIDEIINHCGLNTGTVNSALISLRLKGLIKQLPGNLFRKN